MGSNAAGTEEIIKGQAFETRRPAQQLQSLIVKEAYHVSREFERLYRHHPRSAAGCMSATSPPLLGLDRSPRSASSLSPRKGLTLPNCNSPGTLCRSSSVRQSSIDRDGAVCSSTRPPRMPSWLCSTSIENFIRLQAQLECPTTSTRWILLIDVMQRTLCDRRVDIKHHG